MVMTPDQKRAQFANRGSDAYARAGAEWAEQVEKAKALEFTVRIGCHSGVTQAVADLVAEDYAEAGWAVAFVEATAADPSLDGGHEGEVLIYSVSG